MPEVPTHHIFKTITSTDIKAAWPHLFHEKGFQDFLVITIFGRSRDLYREKAIP